MTVEFDIPPMDPEIAASIRVVMVEPSHPGNIGAAARAMKNMGLHRLVLVKPERFPDPAARFRAASALDVVEQALVVDTLAEAIDDCTLVAGASARNRRVPWPVETPRQAAATVLGEAASGQVALVFGRESSGLTNEELARCQLHLHIPSDPGYPSLNVAMAIQVVAYEVRMAWFDARGGVPDQPWDRPWARVDAVEHLLAHFEQVFERVGFYDPKFPGQVMTRMRRLFFRTRLDQVEVNILRGLLTGVQEQLDGRGEGSRDDAGRPDG